MIGERGREIREFIEDHLGDARPRSVVIASPADDTALARVHGAYHAAAVAEYFRAQGKHVLLVVDSLTRLAMALREIGLAVGEPPATKGYPPSVFGAIAAYVERAGNGDATQGSITALYTVLVEGDDLNEPVTDAVRGILDGHIVLSRAMANFNHYPAIDVLESVSRLSRDISLPEELDLAGRARELLALYRKNEDLISIGAYQKGANAALDRSIALQDALRQFLRQGVLEHTDRTESYALLKKILG